MLLAAAAVVFIGCMGIQYVGYDRLLAAGLRRSALEERRRALLRWVLFALAWQSLVVLAVFSYAFLMTRRQQPDLTWIAPVIAALLGTALPYQLAVMRIARAGRG